MSTPTHSALLRAVEAHVHHEGRRRGLLLTIKEWTRSIGLRGEGQTFSDWKARRMPAGMRRELDTEELLRREVEAGAKALEKELGKLFASRVGNYLQATTEAARLRHDVDHLVKRLARLAAFYLYGLTDEKGETP